MPSDEMVEKVARALYMEGYGRVRGAMPWEKLFERTKETWRTSARAALAAAEAGEQPVAFTTGHCKEKQKPGGCQLHNLHCAYPDCDRKPVASPPSEASMDERAAKTLDLIAKMAGNVVFNGKQRPISHEDHMRAWADIEAIAIRARVAT
jgi:hypothetical protein